MIESMVSKIIIDGINNFSKIFNTPTDLTQIRVYLDEQQTVKYDVCLNWKPEKEVRFKEILNVKLDLLQREALSTPIFKDSVLMFAEKYNVEPTSISVFIFLKTKVGLCVFNGTKHEETLTLKSHLESLGL